MIFTYSHDSDHGGIGCCDVVNDVVCELCSSNLCVLCLWVFFFRVVIFVCTVCVCLCL